LGSEQNKTKIREEFPAQDFILQSWLKTVMSALAVSVTQWEHTRWVK